MSKWGDRPHWAFDAIYLGADEHGEWLGIRAGTHMSRPGAAFDCACDQVGLVPAEGPEEGRHFLATFNAPGAPYWESIGAPVEVYVDLTTPPVWDGTVLRAVDLDLDVVRGTTGRVWIDDEDEFARHRVQYSYPDDVVRAAIRTCEEIAKAARERVAPYDGTTPQRWLDRLAGLAGS